MSKRIARATRELPEFYGARRDWRDRGEERMRFRKATALARVRPPARVLDIGARDGGLKEFLPRQIEYQGIEIVAQFAAPDITIRDISEGIPFTDASYDYVFCIEVLEHVPNPYLTLSEIHRVLRPGGTLIVSVPNPYHFKEVIWNVLHVPDRQGHIYSWTRQTLTRLADMTGFDLEATAGTYLHPPIPMFTLLARSIVYRFVKSAAT